MFKIFFPLILSFIGAILISVIKWIVKTKPGEYRCQSMIEVFKNRGKQVIKELFNHIIEESSITGFFSFSIWAISYPLNHQVFNSELHASSLFLLFFSIILLSLFSAFKRRGQYCILAIMFLISIYIICQANGCNMLIKK